MAKKKKHRKPKKYTQQSLTGQKGINIIERIVLDMGFVWNPTHLEAGIDGIIEIRDSQTQDATNFVIQVQSKATTLPFTAETENSFEYNCDERDLDYWLKGNCPVLLVCSNVVDNKAYWISIKDYFKDQARRKSKKILFNKQKNILTKESRQDLLQLGVPETSGYYLSPPPIKEVIYSNLLKLAKYPANIFEAETKYRKRSELWSALNELNDKKGIHKSWVLGDGKIYSFTDLSQIPWVNFVNSKTIKTFPASNWSKATLLDTKRSFVQLLNNTFETFVHHKGILHKKIDKIDLYYFRPVLDEAGLPETRAVGYNRLGRKSKQTVCDRYARKSDPTIISYYRHLSFEVHFMRIESDWYLEITPTYYFTHDGFKIHTYYESKLKGKKGLDKAETVFSETLFWGDILTRGQDYMFYGEAISFEFLFHSEFGVGLNDDAWLEKEDDEKKKILQNQLSLFDNEAKLY